AKKCQSRVQIAPRIPIGKEGSNSPQFSVTGQSAPGSLSTCRLVPGTRHLRVSTANARGKRDRMDRCSHCGTVMDFDESLCPRCGSWHGVDPGWGSPSVEFADSTGPAYDCQRDAVVFRLLVDGSPVRCLVTLAALRRRFGVGGGNREELEAA